MAQTRTPQMETALDAALLFVDEPWDWVVVRERCGVLPRVLDARRERAFDAGGAKTGDTRSRPRKPPERSATPRNEAASS